MESKATNSDTLIHALVADSRVRVFAVSGRALVAEAMEVHHLSCTATAALGRQLLMTALMASDLKNAAERVSTIIKGDGPGGSMVTTGNFDCTVKGYITNGHVELPLTTAGKLDVSGLVGSRGKLTVVTDMSLREPYVGTCKLVSGEIAEDFANYYTVSLQQPTLCYLGVHLKGGKVSAAGGLLAQPLPGCPEAVIDKLQARAGAIYQLSSRLEAGEKLPEAVKRALGTLDVSVALERKPLYRCDCSRSRIEQALLSTGREEILSMINEDGGAEVTCHFCNKRYRFTGSELEALLHAGEEKILDEMDDSQDEV